MKFARLNFNLALIASAIIFFTLPTLASADTYQIYNLGNDNGYTFYGIDTTGTVVTFNTTSVPLPYTTWIDGVASFSASAPTLVYDNGTPCSPTLSSGVALVGKASCNNGFEVFGGQYLNQARGVYTGPDPADLLQNGTVDELVLNSSGDFAWADGSKELFFEAIDVTPTQVPEPASIFLLGTGILTAAGAMRRRLF